jgi:hypothetical protein
VSYATGQRTTKCPVRLIYDYAAKNLNKHCGLPRRSRFSVVLWTLGCSS